jgi:hypothetical protein
MKCPSACATAILIVPRSFADVLTSGSKQADLIMPQLRVHYVISLLLADSARLVRCGRVRRHHPGSGWPCETPSTVSSRNGGRIDDALIHLPPRSNTERRIAAGNRPLANPRFRDSPGARTVPAMTSRRMQRAISA